MRTPNSTPASGVTDTVVGMVDLSKEPAHVDGRLLRLRKLVVQPGGVVPWHSHHDRPAIILITQRHDHRVRQRLLRSHRPRPGRHDGRDSHDRALVAQ